VSKRITKNTICKAIKEETGWSVKLHKANGYFYFYSDDYDTDMKLNLLESTSIYHIHLSHQSVERWVNDFKDMIEELD